MAGMPNFGVFILTHGELYSKTGKLFFIYSSMQKNVIPTLTMPTPNLEIKPN